MRKTKYNSYLSGKFVKGCKLCLKGEKMVLFVTGLCSRGCEFCPLSKLRKNIDKVYANERLIKNINELLKEVKNSGAKGCSITGGDPLLKLERTIKLGKALKKKFGKKFHIHIYLSTKLVNENNLKKLSRFVDEVRFHPDFEKPVDEEIEKIKLAGKFWNKNNIGIEIPLFPDKLNQIYKFLIRTKDYFSFLNLNELEAGEVTGPHMLKKYKLNSEGYTVKNSIDTGKKLIKKLEKNKIKINMNLCTSKLKIAHQYQNRLKNYKTIKFSKKSGEGTLIYFSTAEKNASKLNKKDFSLDKKKSQIILNPKKVPGLIDKLEIYKIEEYPTYDRDEVLRERI